jgi:hydroxysqualene dehydroxylase
VRVGQSAPRSVAVIGAGWAGLAAALDLARAGAAVTLIESAPMAGGRARTALIDTPLGRFELDNGQHLMMGAYREAIARMTDVGSIAGIERTRLDLSMAGEFRLRAAKLPAPFHLAWALVTARGLTPGERLAMSRMILALRWSGWRADPQQTVGSLLDRFRQPASLVQRIWEPLCIGALNTPVATASASAFCIVLRDTLGSTRDASDFLLAGEPLGALLPEPVLSQLAAMGARIRLGTTARLIRPEASGWRVSTSLKADADPAAERFDDILLALPPWSAARLLEGMGEDTAPMRAYRPEPIATAWVFWPQAQTLRLPRISMLAENLDTGRLGQWLFDRGMLAPQAADGSAARGQRARVAAVVISLASRIDALEAARIESLIADQLSSDLGLPRPGAVRLVTERRATFRCEPGLPRLACGHYRDRYPGLWLAGDWLWPGYPATIEAALLSGAEAARSILATPAAPRQPEPQGSIPG